jgi:hypothetical protein
MTGGEVARALIRFREYTDRELQEAIVTLLDWRNHGRTAQAADRHQALLLAACAVRDERAELGRAVSDAVTPAAELLPDDGLDPGGLTT